MLSVLRRAEAASQPMLPLLVCFWRQVRALDCISLNTCLRWIDATHVIYGSWEMTLRKYGGRPRRGPVLGLINPVGALTKTSGAPRDPFLPCLTIIAAALLVWGRRAECRRGNMPVSNWENVRPTYEAQRASSGGPTRLCFRDARPVSDKTRGFPGFHPPGFWL